MYILTEKLWPLAPQSNCEWNPIGKYEESRRLNYAHDLVTGSIDLP